ncbi:hypothetical protein SSX86_011605 [Deinandra increscens subsp. villosa]|uniref:WRKY domain-containing protein n=1 Tax=Deinandra increscens subsp. villosa TaxID=3103831 RepID=A0AAP0D6W9_9ASTR
MFSSFEPTCFSLDTIDDQTCDFDFGDILDNLEFGTKEQNPIFQEPITTGSTSKSSHNAISVPLMQVDGSKRETVHAKTKFAFRMETKLEVIDDGYKWRKYGKKKVKSSPHLRNYFKCSTIGCNVKKRIERDMEDANYVITTYDGIHNHKDFS